MVLASLSLIVSTSASATKDSYIPIAPENSILYSAHREESHNHKERLHAVNDNKVSDSKWNWCINAEPGINAKNGYYLGVELGRAIISRPPGAAFSSSEIVVIIYPFFGGDYFLKPVIGYRFNDYIAIESSYSKLLNEHYTPQYPENPNSLGPDHYKLSIIDVAGKAIYPFKNGISLYGKFGLAFVHQNVFNQRYINGPILINSNTNRILALFGIGLSYDFNQKFALTLDATNLESTPPIRDIHRLSLGLSYTF